MTKCKICNNLLMYQKGFCSNQCRIKGLHAYLKKNNKGFWNSKLQQELNKRANIINKKNKTGMWNPNFSKIGNDVQKILKTGYWNPEVGRKSGKLGGLRTATILREKKRIKFNGIYFDSYAECEIGMNIHYQIEKLKEGKNYQIKVGFKLIDFFINSCFIEYHPWDFAGRTHKEYYKERRKILNDNGYKNYPLMVIK